MKKQEHKPSPIFDVGANLNRFMIGFLVVGYILYVTFFT
ncbi:hypothetical protein OMQ_01335 [Enterococcus saccharolyticus subsp. saccharolyticus ATCC 43076]|uniref:Uncharacterized protein n=1 Tax=Enterococcus saccharolyticus subsp. saccharolyticus ATCC 43076 TaxID=1139996 RepID=S0NYB5_9ENTE|nr:hypothetical protein OMQ_01335 [Enterococcus saccharolyticus subsp. saccharolyticus ATCC 43076]EOT81181.1 hypothetical protein I572_01713 [Enterococcus saccharolyticus subsp. saccharolyticus ATCC 43076]